MNISSSSRKGLLCCVCWTPPCTILLYPLQTSPPCLYEHLLCVICIKVWISRIYTINEFSFQKSTEYSVLRVQDSQSTGYSECRVPRVQSTQSAEYPEYRVPRVQSTQSTEYSELGLACCTVVWLYNSRGIFLIHFSWMSLQENLVGLDSSCDFSFMLHPWQVFREGHTHTHTLFHLDDIYIYIIMIVGVTWYRWIYLEIYLQKNPHAAPHC